MSQEAKIFRIFVPVTDFERSVALYQRFFDDERGEFSLDARDPDGNGLCFVDRSTLFTGL